MKTYREIIAESRIPQEKLHKNIKVAELGSIYSNYDFSKVDSDQLLGFFTTKANSDGWYLFPLDKFTKKDLEKHKIKTDGVYRIVGKHGMNIIKLNFKTARVQFFDDNYHLETDSYKLEKQSYTAFLTVKQNKFAFDWFNIV
jgi:hypothetical protein